jgi:hypothetical protein
MPNRKNKARVRPEKGISSEMQSTSRIPIEIQNIKVLHIKIGTHRCTNKRKNRA